MIDPETSLAFSVYSNKGVYALLLGSGISRAASVPTGWEVVFDLIQKLAHVLGEDPKPEPEAWYRKRFGKAPDYSELLDSLTKTPAERSQLLRCYFEPSEEERAQGLKAPTVAHRAIAQMIQSGFVRVVITTNFDRLLEQALADLGIGPSLVSTPEAAEGCLPLAHSRCTILKVHGDYLDPHLKNTKIELQAYVPSMDRLLDQIFDEYGVIVCGWSGDWDLALKASLERCPTRRFGSFWCVFGDKPSDVAQKLINQRRATTIKIASADDFFRVFSEKVRALEDFGEAEHPLSTKLGVARLKRHLTAGNLIGIRDLLSSETERTFRVLADVGSSGGSMRPSGEEMVRRLDYYEHHLSALLALCIAASYWAKPETDSLIVECFRRIAQPENPNGRQTFFTSLQRYPALVLLYGIGLATIAAGNYRLLGKLLPLKLRPQVGSEPEHVVDAINVTTVIEGDGVKLIPGQKGKTTPLSNHLDGLLKEPLREFLPDNADYQDAFDWFEYLVALVYVSRTGSPEILQSTSQGDGHGVWGPIGCFGWRQRRREHGSVAEARREDGQDVPESVAKVLESGLFGTGRPSNLELLRQTRRAFDMFLQQATFTWR
ncbi:SIR2 family protein [uncultured Paludibaculum sp.]|uniref:SIR2 family protein n=1 Tax=uncultured Paludibaculum sp. TaxID=1765020 RepID=UPI002AAB39D0|nr:SIR2 family protein [uncultured Paludibaculum sp.]